MYDYYYFIVEIILSGVVSTTGPRNRSSAVFCRYVMVQTLHSCKGMNVGSIRFKCYLAVLLVASSYFFFFFNAAMPSGSPEQEGTCNMLASARRNGNGLLTVHAPLYPSIYLLWTTRETKQCGLELSFELFVTLKLTGSGETQSLSYREQHLSARQGSMNWDLLHSLWAAPREWWEFM